MRHWNVERLSPSPRGTSGGRVGEGGKPIKTRLLSPALSSSSVGREGEERGRFSSNSMPVLHDAPRSAGRGKSPRSIGHLAISSVLAASAFGRPRQRKLGFGQERNNSVH